MITRWLFVDCMCLRLIRLSLYLDHNRLYVCIYHMLIIHRLCLHVLDCDFTDCNKLYEALHVKCLEMCILDTLILRFLKHTEVYWILFVYWLQLYLFSSSSILKLACIMQSMFIDYVRHGISYSNLSVYFPAQSSASMDWTRERKRTQAYLSVWTFASVVKVFCRRLNVTRSDTGGVNYNADLISCFRFRSKIARGRRISQALHVSSSVLRLRGGIARGIYRSLLALMLKI